MCVVVGILMGGVKVSEKNIHVSHVLSLKATKCQNLVLCLKYFNQPRY